MGELNYPTAGETADALVEAGYVDDAREGQHDRHLVIDSVLVRSVTFSDLRRAGWEVTGVCHGVEEGTARTYLHR